MNPKTVESERQSQSPFVARLMSRKNFWPFSAGQAPLTPHPHSNTPLRWRCNERDSVSNHQLLNCLLNRLFWCRSKKTSKLRVTGLCEGNSPFPGEFLSQRASNAENVDIWWCHHASAYWNRWWKWVISIGCCWKTRKAPSSAWAKALGLTSIRQDPTRNCRIYV